MTPYSGRRVCIESAIQEWCGGAVKVPVCEGGRVEITPVGEVFKNEVENVGRDEVRESHTSFQKYTRAGKEGLISRDARTASSQLSISGHYHDQRNNAVR